MGAMGFSAVCRAYALLYSRAYARLRFAALVRLRTSVLSKRSFFRRLTFLGSCPCPQADKLA